MGINGDLIAGSLHIPLISMNPHQSPLISMEINEELRSPLIPIKKSKSPLISIKSPLVINSPCPDKCVMYLWKVASQKV